MPRELWWDHARVPLAVFVLLACVCAATGADAAIAGLFFDSMHREWIGTHNWWVNELVHTGGRFAIRMIVLFAIAVAIVAGPGRAMHALRRPAICLSVSIAASVGIVGLLKTITNVDCPWDLSAYGGDHPFVHLFADRPDGLRGARCFPAAHAASGYALLALYFVFRERSIALARAGLALGVVTGLVFGFSQQARGAHFLSHDLCSAFISWIVPLTIYTFGFKARLWNQPWSSPHESRLAARGLSVDGYPALRRGAR